MSPASRFIVLLAFVAATLGAWRLFPLLNQRETTGERIIFFGDSITQAGDQPGGYVTIVRDAIGSEEVEVIAAGVGGNRVPDLQSRLKWDVLMKRPTTVVIYVGINDVWHFDKWVGTPKDEFESGLKDMIRQIKGKGAKVILCTTSMLGERADGSNKYDELLDEYCDIIRAVASDTGSQLIDLRNLFVDYLKQNNPEQKPHGVLTVDGIHLNPEGNRFLADAMLRVLANNSQPIDDVGIQPRIND